MRGGGGGGGRGGPRSGRGKRPRGGKDDEEPNTGGQRLEEKGGKNPIADKKPGDGPQNEKYGSRNARSARPKTGDQLQDGERPRNNKTPRQHGEEGEQQERRPYRGRGGGRGGEGGGRGYDGGRGRGGERGGRGGGRGRGGRGGRGGGDGPTSTDEAYAPIKTQDRQQ